MAAVLGGTQSLHTNSFDEVRSGWPAEPYMHMLQLQPTATAVQRCTLMCPCCPQQLAQLNPKQSAPS